MGHQRKIARYAKGTMKATRQANRISVAGILGTSLASSIQQARAQKAAEREREQAEALIRSMHAQPPPPAGWYPDVEREGGLRWWDGQQWTEYRSRPE